MNALAIIGCALGGGFIGAVGGMALGMREGGDFNFAPVIYAPIGAVLVGFLGVIIGAVVFA